METTLANVATGYRFHTGECSTVDVMLGMRAMSIENTLEIQNLGMVSGDNTVYDGFVALRPRFAITRYWFFSPTMMRLPTCGPRRALRIHSRSLVSG